MILRHSGSIRLVVSIAAFVVALILLTGTPAAVRNIVLKNSDSMSDPEVMVSLTDVVVQQ
jgi:hypothetical protein